jgi:hypothetical protein
VLRRGRREAKLGVAPRDDRLVPGAPHGQLDARDLARAGSKARQQRVAALGEKRVDHRRALGGAERDLRVQRARIRRLQHGEVLEVAPQRDRLLHRRVRVIGDDDDRVVLEEGVDPSGGVGQALELPVRDRDRNDLRMRPVLVGVGVVVGQRQKEEVEEVLLHEVRADAARVAVADTRQPEL